MPHDTEYYRQRLGTFREAEEAFFSGNMSPKEYKGISGGFGSYAQRGGKLGMVRLRMCGGHMDKDKLAFILSKVRQYGIGRIHTTTCETVQLHDLTGEQILDIMDCALDHGINTQGGGGDHPRNVSASSLSGVDPGEHFDVYPYAKATEEYLLDIMTHIRLPRKLKVTFSSSDRNETHATFRDLGFVARPDGYFDVWSAGGLGNNPRMGCLIAEAIDTDDVLYYVRGMVEVFREYGDYENRGRSRTRYIKENLGEEEYVRVFRWKVALAMAEGRLSFVPVVPVFPVKPVQPVSGERIHPQKQEGLYYVEYRPIGGDIPADMLQRIHDTIADMDGVEVRVSPDSALYIINLSGEEALTVRDATEGGASSVFETSVSCIGGRICQTGTRDSNGLLNATIAAVRDAGIPSDCLPRFRISGCPSSCGAHQVGCIGLQGTTKTVDGVNTPAYNVTVRGCGLQGRERFGDLVGAVAESRVPDMVVHLGRTVADSGMDFHAWLSSDEGILERTLAPYMI